MLHTFQLIMYSSTFKFCTVLWQQIRGKVVDYTTESSAAHVRMQ